MEEHGVDLWFCPRIMGAFVFNQGHQLTKALRMC